MSTEQNKELVKRYNHEVIQGGNMEVLRQLAAPDFINHSAPEAMDAGIEGMAYFFSSILHAAFSKLIVTVHDMVAEDNRVVTRKTISGVHTGSLMGIEPTGKPINITVIDIITVDNGRLLSHWGENNFAAVMQSLAVQQA
jgi:predicted ester cyclase